MRGSICFVDTVINWIDVLSNSLETTVLEAIGSPRKWIEKTVERKGFFNHFANLLTLQLDK